MSVIVIRYDGTNISNDVIFRESNFTSRADGLPGQCLVVIDNQNQQWQTGDFVSGKTLELLVDGVRMWDGWLFNVNRTWPFPALDTRNPAQVPTKWMLQGLDRNLLLQKRVLYRQDDPDDPRGLKIWPSETPDKTALNYVLNNYVDLSGDGLKFDIREISSPGPFEDFTLGYVGAPLGVAFEDCSKMTGGVYFVSPQRVLTYLSDLIPTKAYGLSDAPTGNDKGYREVTATLDFMEAANEAKVWGAGKGSANVVFANVRNSDSVSTYGLWQWGDIFVGAYKQQTVNRRARTYVYGSPDHRRGHDEPVPKVSCKVYNTNLHAGDVVQFTMEAFDYSEPLPIRECMVSFPTPNDIEQSLSLSLNIDHPFTAPDLWKTDWDYRPTETTVTGGEEFPSDTDPLGNLIDDFDDGTTSGVATSGGYYPGYGSIRINYPPGMAAGKVLIVELAFDNWDLINGYRVDPVYTLENTWGWEGPGSNGAFYYGGLDLLGGKTIYKFLDGTEDQYLDYFPFTPYTNPFGRTAYWAAVARVEDLKESAGSPGFLDWVTWDWSATWAGIGANAPTDGTFRLMMSIVTTGAAPTNEPTGWTRIGQKNTSNQVAVYSYVKDEDATLTSGSPYPLPTGTPWTGASQYFFMAALLDTLPDDPTTGDGALLTPGQTRTEAPWVGGNEYRDSIIEGSYENAIEIQDAYGPVSSRFDIPNSMWKTRLQKSSNGTPYAGVYLHGDYFSLWSGNPEAVGTVMTDEEWGPWDGSTLDAYNGYLNLLIKWRMSPVPIRDDAGMPMPAMTVEYNPIVWSGGVPYLGDSLIIPFGNGYSLGGGEQIRYAMPYMEDNTQYYAYWDDKFPFATYYPMYVSRARATETTGIFDETNFVTGIYADYGGLYENEWLLTRIVWDPTETWTASVLWPNSDGSASETPPPFTGTIKSRTWLASEVEPTTQSYPNLLGSAGGYDVFVDSPTGWDCAVPMMLYPNEDASQYNAGRKLLTYGRSHLRIRNWLQQAFGYTWDGNNDANVDIDYVRAFVPGVTRYQSASGVVDDYEIQYVNTEEGSAVYKTKYPYVAGTLRVYVQGNALRLLLEYLETDPQEGLFTTFEPKDMSKFMRASYTTYGSDPYTITSTYRPTPLRHDGYGTQYDGLNVLFACSAMALDHHTRNATLTTPGEQRIQSGIGAVEPGLSDLNAGWSNGWGQSYAINDTTTWTKFYERIKEGRGAVLQGKYSDLPADKQVKAWTKSHALYVNDSPEEGMYWAVDPLQGYGLLYTEQELKDYAAGLIGVLPGYARAIYTNAVT